MGLDDVLEAIRRISIVADELDLLDAGFRALGNLENEIDAVVGLLDDLGVDVNVVAAVVAIDFGDVFGVGLNHWPGKGSTRLGLYFS